MHSDNLAPRVLPYYWRSSQKVAPASVDRGFQRFMDTEFRPAEPWIHRLRVRLEQKTLEVADALVTVSVPWATRLGERYTAKPIYMISNGFDPDDFQPRPQRLLGPSLTICSMILILLPISRTSLSGARAFMLSTVYSARRNGTASRLCWMGRSGRNTGCLP
jgi:hypothetical protein